MVEGVGGRKGGEGERSTADTAVAGEGERSEVVVAAVRLRARDGAKPSDMVAKTKEGGGRTLR